MIPTFKIISAPGVSCLLLLLAVHLHSCAGQDVELTGHEGSVTMARFVGDGAYVVTSCTDGTARLFNSVTGSELRRYSQHTAPILCLDVSNDGALLATGAQDNTVRLWDLPSARPVRTLKLTDRAIRQIEVGKAGETFFVGGQNGFTAATFAADSDGIVQQEPVAHAIPGSEVTAVSLRSDETLIVTGDATGQITCWSPFLKKSQLQFQADDTAITGAWFYGSGALITVGQSGNVKVWQVSDALAGRKVKKEDGTESVAVPGLVREFRPGNGKVIQAVSAGNGAQVIAVTDAGKSLLCDVNSGKFLRETANEGQKTACIAVRPDNQRIIAGTDGGLLLLSNTGESILQQIATESPIVSLAWSSDGKKVAAVDGARKVYIYGPSLTGQPQQELVRHQTIESAVAVSTVAFSSDARSVWVGGQNGTATQWRIASPTQIRQLSHGGAVYGVAFTTDSKSVVTCGADQTVRLWNTVTGQQRFQMRGHQGAIHAVAVNADSTLAISSGADGTLRLWDIVGGRQLKELSRFDATMYTAGLHSNGQHAFVGGADRQIHIVELASGRIVRTMKGHSDYVHSVRLNADETRLISYGYGGSLRIWDYATGKQLSSADAGRIGNYADLSHDQMRVLVANGDGIARILKTPQ